MTQNTEESYLDFRRNNPEFHKAPDSCAIISGGLDSTTLVYDMLNKGYTPHLLSFNYGQRHKKELTFAAATAKSLRLEHNVIDLSGITHLISNSALTDTLPKVVDSIYDKADRIEVPEGHYAEESMKATVVPNRNMIMISIAGGIAVNNKYQTIGIGVHGGDHFVYPDCRPRFIFDVGQTLLDGNEGFHNFFNGEEHPLLGGRSALPIFAPYLHASKEDIAYRALELRVPLHLTWSCYKGGDKHCGKCGTCVERLEAIHGAQQRAMENELNGGNLIEDHTEYEDNEFWRTAVAP